jgi:hypothetical protein
MTRKHWFAFFLAIACIMIMAGSGAAAALIMAKKPVLEVVAIVLVFAVIAARHVYRALEYLIPKTMSELG